MLKAPRQTGRLSGQERHRSPIRFSGNTLPTEDEAFVREALPEFDDLLCIPMNDEIRKADRDGVSIVDVLSPELEAGFDKLLATIDRECRPVFRNGAAE